MKKILSLILSMVVMFGFSSKAEAFFGKKSNKLVVYTNSGSNGRADHLKEMAAKAGFDIEIVEAGGGEIANRMIAEKNRPVADVVYGLNAIEYEKFKANDILEAYTPVWADQVPAGLSDPTGYYNAVSLVGLGLAYNKEVVGNDIPTDWIELATNPKFKNKYTILNLDSGTSRTILASILVRYKDSDGELGISEEGWEIARQYIQNGHLETTGEDWFGNLVNGTRPMTMLWGSGMIEREEQYNMDLGVMNPELGVPFVVEQLALVKGTKKAEEAKRFIDWFGSVEPQVEWANNFGTTPAIPEALARAPKHTVEFMKKMDKIQELDWQFIGANIEAWAEKVQLEYVY